jgi:hypothetical protein
MVRASENRRKETVMERELLISRPFNCASGKWYGTFLEDMLTITLGAELRPARHKHGGQAVDLLKTALKNSDRPVHF